jgi:uncharacterized delta-60 repeat protein
LLVKKHMQGEVMLIQCMARAHVRMAVCIIFVLSSLIFNQGTAVRAAATDIDPTFVAQVLLNGTTRVHQIAVQADGKMLVAGILPRVNGVWGKNLVRLLRDGSLDPAFNADIGNEFVSDFAIQSDGKILLVEGQTRLLRLNSNGSRDTSFISSTSPQVQPVNSLFIDSAGRIITHPGNVGAPSVIYNPDGSLYNGSGPTVYAIDSAGRLLALEVRNSGGINYPYIVRYLANYTLDTSFTATPLPFWPERRAIGFQTDNKIVFGGYNPVNFNPQPAYMVRLLANGGIDSSFNFTVPSRVSDFSLRPDNSIVATLIDAQPVRQRILSDGSVDTSFVFPVIPGNDQAKFLYVPNGKVLLYSNFDKVGNPERSGIVRFLRDSDPTPPAPSQCPVKRFWGDGSGSWGQSARESFPAGTTFKLVNQSSTSATAIVWNQSNAVRTLSTIGSTFTTPSQLEFTYGFAANSSNNNSGQWVDIEVCGPDAEPPPSTCTIKRYAGDGTGNWGKYSKANYPGGTTFTLVARSTSAAKGMVFNDSIGTIYLNDINSSTTATVTNDYNVGFFSTTANSATNWVDINICVPSGSTQATTEEVWLGDEFPEPAAQHRLFAPIVWNN